MAEFADLISGVKSALERGKPASAHDDQGAGARPDGSAPAPVADLSPAALLDSFCHQLELVSGHAHQVSSGQQAIDKIASIAIACGTRRAAVAAGITIDFAALTPLFDAAEINIVAPPEKPPSQRRDLIDDVARCQVGVIEADCAIALTGTVAHLAEPSRPRAFSLLPEVSIIVIRADRIVPNLAACIARLGTERLASHQMVLITGPSRTADIEKRIVLGVHGPRDLHVIVVGGEAPR